MSKPIRRIVSLLLVLQLIIPYSTFAAAVGEFTSVVGSVTQARAKEVIRPAPKSSIELKDVVATDRASSTSMVFSDNSTIMLSENTRMEIGEFLFKETSRRGLFSLITGKLTVNVNEKKYIGGANVFEVRSPTALVGVRGTGFEFVEAIKESYIGSTPVKQGMATVSCTEGSLNLSAFSPTGVVVSTAVLEAGQMAVIIGGVITVSVIGTAAVTAAVARAAEAGAAGAAGGAGTGTGGVAAAGSGAAATTGLSTATTVGLALGGAAVVGGVAAAGGGGGSDGGSSSGGGGSGGSSLASYTISGGPDIGMQFNVDDILRIYVNGALVRAVERNGQCCSPPITFTGSPSGTLRLIGEDTWGGTTGSGRCYTLDPLYLHKQGNSAPIVLLQTRIWECSELPRIQFFFDQSYTLP